MNNIARKTAKYWLAASFAISFFAVGVPYWQIPYAKVSLPDTLYGAGLLVVGLVAFATRAGQGTSLSGYLHRRCRRARCGTRAGRCGYDKRSDFA